MEDEDEIETNAEELTGSDDEVRVRLTMAVLRSMATLYSNRENEDDDDSSSDLTLFTSRDMMVLIRQSNATTRSNYAMVKDLERSGSINSRNISLAFQTIDRAYFLRPFVTTEDCAYVDLPIHAFPLHQSAPSLYGRALEALQLQPGDSFLNIGSGSGYLSAIAARLIGPEAHHVGIESRLAMVTAARAKFSATAEKSFWPQAADILKRNVQFIHCDCYALDSSGYKFNKIYVGAGARASARFLFRLLKEDGILVGPFDNRLNLQNLIIVKARGGGAYNVAPFETDVNFAWLVSDHDPHPLANGTNIHLPSPSQSILLKGPIWSHHSISQFPSTFIERVRLLSWICSHDAYSLPILPADIWRRHILAYLPADCFEPVSTQACAHCGATPPAGKSFAKCLRCSNVRFCSKSCQGAGYGHHLETSSCSSILRDFADSTSSSSSDLASSLTAASVSRANDDFSSPADPTIRLNRRHPLGRSNHRFDSWLWDDFDDIDQQNRTLSSTLASADRSSYEPA